MCQRMHAGHQDTVCTFKEDLLEALKQGGLLNTKNLELKELAQEVLEACQDTCSSLDSSDTATSC